jgi:hypothetical protein
LVLNGLYLYLIFKKFKSFSSSKRILLSIYIFHFESILYYHKSSQIKMYFDEDPTFSWEKKSKWTAVGSFLKDQIQILILNYHFYY